MINKKLNFFEGIAAGAMNAWITSGRLCWSNTFYGKGRITSPVSHYSFIDKKGTLLFFPSFVYNNFEYTTDGAHILFDAMRSPQACHYDLIYKKKLKDDCDGIHAAFMHEYNLRGIESWLFTYTTDDITEAHSVVVSQLDGKFYITDYTRIYHGYDFNTVFNELKKFRKLDKIYAAAATKWDTSKEKYVDISKQKLAFFNF